MQGGIFVHTNLQFSSPQSSKFSDIKRPVCVLCTDVISLNRVRHVSIPKLYTFIIAFFLNLSQPPSPLFLPLIRHHIPEQWGWKQGWAGIPVPVHSQEWKPLIPFPELWEWIFSFPSHSRIVGMDFFHSPTVPDLWEWIFLIPFPFLNLLFHRRESKRELDYSERYQNSIFSAFSTS